MNGSGKELGLVRRVESPTVERGAEREWNWRRPEKKRARNTSDSIRVMVTESRDFKSMVEPEGEGKEKETKKMEPGHLLPP